MSGSWPESSGLRRPDGFEMIEISLGEMDDDESDEGEKEAEETLQTPSEL